MMDRQFFIGLCVGVLAPIISFAIYVLFEFYKMRIYAECRLKALKS